MGTRLRLGGQKKLVGGCLERCLSDSDIDGLLLPVLGERCLPARLLFDFSEGKIPAGDVMRKIEDASRKEGWCLAAVWARHHWATSLVKRDGGG